MVANCGGSRCAAGNREGVVILLCNPGVTGILLGRPEDHLPDQTAPWSREFYNPRFVSDP